MSAERAGSWGEQTRAPPSYPPTAVFVPALPRPFAWSCHQTRPRAALERPVAWLVAASAVTEPQARPLPRSVFIARLVGFCELPRLGRAGSTKQACVVPAVTSVPGP